MDISVSEILNYLRCRRMWDIQSLNRQGLRKTGVPSFAFQLGSAFHEAFDAQAQGNDPITAVTEFFEHEIEKMKQDYQITVGAPPSPIELTQFNENRDNTLALVERYFEKYNRDNPIFPYEYVQTEQTFRIPIPTTDGFFIGTFDGLARHTQNDTKWIVEHKTYSMKPDLDRLQTDLQITGYHWAYFMLFNEVPSGVLYDGIAKKLPKVPEILKNGKVSQKWIDTDYQTYVRALVHNGQSPDEDDYQDILKRLKERDNMEQNPFFTRWIVRRSVTSIQLFEHMLIAVYQEMSNPNLAIVPNFLWNGCNDCFVRDLCVAIESGDDLDYIMSRYKKSTGHASIQRQQNTRVAVSSFDDL